MALVSALDDRELPVRVQAALSLGETIHNDDGMGILFRFFRPTVDLTRTSR